MYRIGDFLIKLKNAQNAKKESVIYPYSKEIFNIAKLLEKNRFIGQATQKEKNKKKYLRINLLYKNGFPLITNVKLISKPSCRIYTGYKKIKKVKQGYGLGIISTPKGVLNDEEARRKKVGGEYIAQVW